MATPVQTFAENGTAMILATVIIIHTVATQLFSASAIINQLEQKFTEDRNDTHKIPRHDRE